MRVEMVVFRKFSPPAGFPNSTTQGWWFISEASFSKTPLRWSSFELQSYGDYSNSAGFYYVCINFSVSKCTALSIFPDVIRNCIIPTSQFSISWQFTVQTRRCTRNMSPVMVVFWSLNLRWTSHLLHWRKESVRSQQLPRINTVAVYAVCQGKRQILYLLSRTL